jgi:hypothetical protein
MSSDEVVGRAGGDDVPGAAPRPARRRQWKPLIGLLALAGLIWATVSSLDDVQGRTLPSWQAILAAFVLQVVALGFVGRAWAVLFPADADRADIAGGFYISQLTKYLPAGGFLQAASQVALSRHNGGLGMAAVRLPVFSLAAVTASFTVGSILVLDGDLPAWGRALAAAGLGSLVTLDRRVLAKVLTVARRYVRRLPHADRLPPQRLILACYGLVLVNMVASAAGFAILLRDLVDVHVVFAGAAFCAAWGLGFLALPIPSGIFIREGVLLAALPGVATGTVLAVSVTQRLVGFVVEALYAGGSQVRAARRRRTAPRADDDQPPHPGTPPAEGVEQPELSQQ